MVSKSLLSILLCLAACLILQAGGEGSVRGGGGGSFVGIREAAASEEEGMVDIDGQRRNLREASNSASLVGGASGPVTEGNDNNVDFDAFCIPRNNSLTYNLTSDERNMTSWINSARRSKGLGTLSYHADLVVEAQRWARSLANRSCSGRVSTRDYISRNIWCDTWDELGEYVISNSRSVRRAFTSLMGGRGARYVYYKPYDRFGVGIRKCGKWFYVVLLFKNRS
jgi:uncharacterized protein YkwD